MSKYQKALTGMAVLALAGSTLAAQGSSVKKAWVGKAGQGETQKLTKAKSAPLAKPTKSVLREGTGTVVTADATRLVISHKVKGKNEEMTFTLVPETQKTGILEPGALAKVKYRVEDGENVATLVKASPAAHTRHSTKKS